ncbi:STT3 domain-containing protein [Candidatus Magnetomonas plexicatena]|uniref:STT3 domain-containing protein n=1 Tax=Candidatus Magnetomonas plexicatena TaxID=2552947 RepID=UPI001C7844B2|nr:hypothetical protein E2O03_012535 [Nitrospirales bacterium LBB_01]
MSVENSSVAETKILTGKIIFGAAVLLCLFLSVFVRYHAMSKWNMQPEMYFYGSTPMMSTVDAYDWIINANEYLHGIPALESPLISVIAVRLSGLFGNNVSKAAFYMVFFLSGLFIIPLSLFFYKAGHPGAGISASVFGTVGKIYYERTAIGRFDTDLLNLFFPFLVSFFILKSSKAKTHKRTYLYSALTGIALSFFDWWYQGHRGFTFIYLAILVISLVFYKVKYRHIVVSFLLCFSFSFLNEALLSLSNTLLLVVVFIIILSGFLLYTFRDAQKWDTMVHAIALVLFLIVFTVSFNILKPELGKLLSFTHRFTAVTSVETIKTVDSFPGRESFTRETKHYTPQVVMSTIFYSGAWLAVIGFLGFLVFIILNFRAAFILLPIFLIGLLSFKSEIRLAMYLPPFVGAGLGYLLTLAASPFRIFLNKLKKEILVYMFIFALFFATNFSDAYSYNPFVLINGKIYKGFTEVKKFVPPDSKMFTWWDTGYALQSIGLKTYHDPGPMTQEITYFTARGLTVTSQRELYSILCYIDRVASKSKVNDNAKEKIQKAINLTPNLKGNNVYVLFSNDMILTFNAVTNIGNWDFDAKVRQYKKPIKFLRETSLESERGILNGNIPVKSIITVDSGEIKDTQTFINNPAGQYLEIIKSGQTVLYILLMDEGIYQSNFNKMFILGIFDKNLFEEIYNDFPHVRLYKAKG